MKEKVSIQGNVIEVTEMDWCNRECRAKRLDAEHYLRLDTGEVCEYEQHGDTRADNVQNLRRTFKRLRALINTNCTDWRRLRWITLTYAENMTDRERLYDDFKKFMKRFRRAYGACEYIVVVEPQERGAWHVHMIGIFGRRAPFIENAELREIWGHGFVSVKSLKNVDNIGAYLSAYLADLPTDGKEGEVKTCKDGTSKRIVKGGRLALYPVGMQIYRHSRGLKEPEEFWVDSDEAEERKSALLNGAAETYSRVFQLTDENGRTYKVRKTYYNRARKSNH